MSPASAAAAVHALAAAAAAAVSHAATAPEQSPSIFESTSDQVLVCAPKGARTVQLHAQVEHGHLARSMVGVAHTSADASLREAGNGLGLQHMHIRRSCGTSWFPANVQYKDSLLDGVRSAGHRAGGGCWWCCCYVWRAAAGLIECCCC